MRVAIISDIHGECFPLDHVLKDIKLQNIETVVCLGDAIQGGSQPAETVSRLRELKCPIVMGNADAWLLSGKETSQNEKVSEKQLEVRAWSLRQLSRDDTDFIGQFHSTVQIELGKNKKLLCFHGSPRSFDDVILPTTSDDDIRKFFSGFNATFFAGGHTHIQQIRRIGDWWYVNPGSVALPYNWEHSNMISGEIRVDPWADYAILSYEDNTFGVAFRHVFYEVIELASIIRKSGRPHAEQAIAAYPVQNSSNSSGYP
jgi:predicted phosphodiesterase